MSVFTFHLISLNASYSSLPYLASWPVSLQQLLVSLTINMSYFSTAVMKHFRFALSVSCLWLKKWVSFLLLLPSFVLLKLSLSLWNNEPKSTLSSINSLGHISCLLPETLQDSSPHGALSPNILLSLLMGQYIAVAPPVYRDFSDLFWDRIILHHLYRRGSTLLFFLLASTRLPFFRQHFLQRIFVN